MVIEGEIILYICEQYTDSFLKARATLANCNRHIYVSARGSISPSMESRSTSNQAYLDLLKASYILYNVVLGDEALTGFLIDEDRKSIVELSEVGIPAYVYVDTCD